MVRVIYTVISIAAILTFIIVFLYQQIIVVRMPFYQRALFFIILTGIIITSAYIRLLYIEEDTLEAKVLRPIAAPITKSVKAIHDAQNSKEIEAIITPLLENQKGKYSVVIKNLKTNEHYNLNENEIYTSASLYKLWTMGTVYQKIEEGTLTKEKKLSSSIESLNKIFDLGEDAELSEGSISSTVEEALEQMITISHNYSAMLLTVAVKNANVKKFLTDNGFTNSKTGIPPKTTATDIAELFEKLYDGELVTPQASTEMIDLLKRQKLNDRIPKYLPDGIEVAHKTGELAGAKHDAGIVFSEKGDYIIVLMSDTPSMEKAAEVEAKISKAVWEYFEKQ